MIMIMEKWQYGTCFEKCFGLLGQTSNHMKQNETMYN